VSCTPAFAAEPPVSCQTAWLSRLTITSSPGRVRTRSATWLAIVPLGSQSAASLPSSAATVSWSRFDRRVLAVLVVADGRRRHRRAHLGRRPGDGVGAQVDRGFTWTAGASSFAATACSANAVPVAAGPAARARRPSRSDRGRAPPAGGLSNTIAMARIRNHPAVVTCTARSSQLDEARIGEALQRRSSPRSTRASRCRAPLDRIEVERAPGTSGP
jgi:hypothetical protein